MGNEPVRGSPSIVELENVRLDLGGRTIQQDMTLRIEDGEYVAVLGPNGAGKSTLLKALLGLVRPSAGRLRVLGGTPGTRNNAIGYVPQFRAIESDLSLRGRDIVRFGLDGNRWGPGWPSRKRSARIDEVLREVDGLELANQPIGRLSGGERQRLLIAQALVTDPRLLLLDEPLANLDISREQDIVALVRRICRSRKVAVLFVTHDINPLLPDIDRVLYLAGGRSAIGIPAEVITRECLSTLYGSPVEVVTALNRVFVVGAQI